MNVESIYFAELKKINEKYPVLTKEQEIELCKKIQAGDKKAEETLILSNLNLVIKVINRLHLSNVEKMDLIQDGNIALIEKAKNYNYEKGARFSTYIWQWIWDEALSNNIILSERDNRIMRKIQKVKKNLKNEKGEEPSMKEIADILNMSEEALNNKLNHFEASNMVSLDAPLKDEDGSNFSLDKLEFENPYGKTEEVIIRQVEKQQIQKAIKRLPEKEQLIINERYIKSGEETGKINSLRDVAACVDMTSEGVRIVEKRAKEQLKIILKREGLVA